MDFVEFLEKLLRKAAISLFLLVLAIGIMIKSFNSAGIITNMQDVRNGVDTFKSVTNYSNNLDDVFNQIENLGK